MYDDIHTHKIFKNRTFFSKTNHRFGIGIGFENKNKTQTIAFCSQCPSLLTHTSTNLFNDNFIKDEGLTRAWSGKKFHFLQIQKTSGLFLQEFLERYFLKGIEYVISIDPPFIGLACPIQNVKSID